MQVYVSNPYDDIMVLGGSSQAQTGAPCLSFDMLRDSLGDGRETYPMTAYLVAGTQAETTKQNFVILIKMSRLNQTEQEEGVFCSYRVL